MEKVLIAKLLKCLFNNLIFMGRVRNAFVKRNAEKIIKKYPDGWSKNFEENKASLKTKADFASKKIRNRVAGFLTFVKKKGKSLNKVE